MAEKNLSRDDQQKKLADNMAELRERGIADAQTIHALTPEGAVAATDQMLQKENQNFVRDQSQEQLERGRESGKQNAADSQRNMERLRKTRGLS